MCSMGAKFKEKGQMEVPGAGSYEIQSKVSQTRPSLFLCVTVIRSLNRLVSPWVRDLKSKIRQE